MKLRLNIFKKQINKYHFKTKNIRNHYISGAGKGFMTKKEFWNYINPFWQTKCFYKTIMLYLLWLSKTELWKIRVREQKSLIITTA